ncbi:2-phosphosulfolactate phosphatase [Actinokineospora sp. HUAS TT18]|uniref:2-phosphosulfolactate phosphatase n=1 Tax=Actinokineospora sp. HUAS TT18 TaxID=3447451 RepID=UPI003F526207
MDPSFEQSGFDVRVEWGLDGVAALAGSCKALVIVDVLSFTTSVDIAVSRGGRVLPMRYRDAGAVADARAAGAVLPEDGGPWTLRPSSLVDLPAGTFLGLPSPNGATLSAAAAETGVPVFAGCLRNAPAVAAAVRGLGPVGVVAASERWGHVGALRPCVEDQLGAGAIAHAIGGALSPEARLAEAAFLAFADDLRGFLWESSSGRELRAAGHPGDVELAADHGASSTVPTLVSGVYE